MNFEEDIFKHGKIDLNKLLEYGFQKENDFYVYKTLFMDGRFQAIITISEKNNLSGKVLDIDSDEEYLGFRVLTQTGEFVNKVRESYQSILKDIFNFCFTKQYFIHDQSNRVTDFIQLTYHVEPEFLWKTYPDYGVFRNSANGKWFGIIMSIDKRKLGLEEEEEIEVINIKTDNHTEDLLRKNGIFPAYHMSKKNWVSIILDDTLSDDEIIVLIGESYNNVK